MTWLDELKEGDTVIVQDSSCTDIGKVSRITNSQIVVICGGERKYWKKNGEIVGSRNACYTHQILEGTLEEIHKVKESVLRSELKEKLNNLWAKKINKLGSHQLQKLIDYLEEA